MKRFLVLTYGVVNYVVFLGVFLYLAAFIGNLWVPRSMVWRIWPCMGGSRQWMVQYRGAVGSSRSVRYDMDLTNAQRGQLRIDGFGPRRMGQRPNTDAIGGV